MLSAEYRRLTHRAEQSELLQSFHHRHNHQVQPRASMTTRSSCNGSCRVQNCAGVNIVGEAEVDDVRNDGVCLKKNGQAGGDVLKAIS